MKNHWLEVRRRKQNKVWTAEFLKHGVFCLQPRQVGIASGTIHSGLLGQNSGNVSIVFAGAISNTSDNELLDFLSESSQGGMTDMVSCLKKYDNIMSASPTDCYEISRIDYDSIGTGFSSNDLSLSFKFKRIQKLIVP